MDGYLLLADGTRLDGELRGAPQAAVGWVVANTSVVGFQEMLTDPTYRNAVLTFTYPEVGSVGFTAAFSESPVVQAAALAVKRLSDVRSHYLSERNLEKVLAEAGVPCLCDVDTRGVGVHLREHGEMAAAVAPADSDSEELLSRLAGFERPVFPPTDSWPSRGDGPPVAVVNLGIRASDLAQIRACCAPALFARTASPEGVLASGPAAVLVSDGPGMALPPGDAVELLKGLVGRVPVFAWGLGHVALGLALGCEARFLKRGHHGANYPVRKASSGALAVTVQRHSIVLDRESVEAADGATLTWENLNDGTVEGIASADGTAAGIQFMPVPPYAGAVSPLIERFVESLSG